MRAEEDPLQQREPSRFAFPSTCRCWSPFKGHTTLPWPLRAGDTQTWPGDRDSTAGRAGTPQTSHGGSLAKPDTVQVAKYFQGTCR